jgi:pilus assembly protein CpaB
LSRKLQFEDEVNLIGRKECCAMKQAQLVSLGIAAVCGVAAIFGMSKLGGKKVDVAVPQQVDATMVLVAKQDIALGQIATADNFRWQEWPAGAVSPSYVQDARRPNALKDFTGRIARAPIMKDEPVTDHKLIKAGEGGVLAAILPAGMRAISTKINEATAVGRLILPNDYVDVILIQRRRAKAGGGEDYVSDTLFRNVRVLAIGQLIEAKEGKKNAEGNTATLELTPRQSELLALANAMGEISLTLRSVADVNQSTPGASERSQRGNSIRVLRYGVKSRAYGVN